MTEAPPPQDAQPVARPVARATGRRADLDWLRVIAFGLLILFHTSLAYAPFDWHVHSNHTFGWLAEAILATGPWRLTLLFLVSGAALRYMSRRLSPGEMVKARMIRLVPPFVFGVLFLIPPQAWLEAVDKGGWTQGLVPWWLHQFSPAQLVHGLPINHLWFVLYIIAYTFAGAAVMLKPGLPEKIGDVLERTLGGWRLLVLPMAYLAIVRILLFPWFGLTNQIHVDWYNHAISLAAFLFGFCVTLREPIWRDFERLRRIALGVAVVSVAVLMFQYAHRDNSVPGTWLRFTVYAINQWAAIAALLGYGSRYLRNADAPALRYLTDAVFPCYLAHQTILVIMAFMAKRWNLPALPEAALLVGVTLGGSLLVYEIVKRSGPLRPLWGLRRHPKPAPAVRSEAA